MVAAVGATLLTLVYLLMVVGDALDAATVFLSASAGVLVLGLRGMFSMVQALARPPSQGPRIIEDELAKSEAELREDKKRVLSAIKELDFDFELGKLSKDDYATVSAAYRLRAVDVLRRLEGSGALHPELKSIVDSLESPSDEAADSGASEIPENLATQSPDATDSACGECGGVNDGDAKFCKHCGKAIAQ
jgi:hypothetical protein